MTNTVSVLTTDVMHKALADRGVNDVFVEVFDSLPSTSAYLSAVAQQTKAKSVNSVEARYRAQLCVADWQTNGSGRRGKSWVTDRGNVTFSLLLSLQKPPAELLGLSLVTGICVAESLSAQANLSVQLKWPNDVLVEGKKLCGLLTELVSGANGVTNVVVGVGINYRLPTNIEHSDYEIVSLPMVSEHPPQRSTLISDIGARLIESSTLFEQQGWPAFADRWRQFDYLKGREVRVINAGVEEQATAIGVNDNGALLVEKNAQTTAVYSGEVSVRLA